MDCNFTPEIWIEDKAPEEAAIYEQCEVCSSRSRIILGEGNPNAPIVVILDNPGAREDKEGKEYVCGTRQTLLKVIHDVNLTPNDVYVTYLLKCRPLGRYNKEKARDFSKPFLIKQINIINPKVLVLLGDIVVQSMLNDDEAHVKDLRGSWHNVLSYPTAVSYHPLAVKRRPNLMKNFMQDWEMIAQRFLQAEI